MSTVVSQPLVAGQRLNRDEFLRRWEAMPNVKKAELIGGVVYMPSPVSRSHGIPEMLVHTWIGYYAVHTPGCGTTCNSTWLMLEDAPQPDADLWVLPEYGGQSRVEGIYGGGAPELAAEVCLSSSSYDLGPKLELYQAAGVQEYIAVILGESRVLWHRLGEGKYAYLERSPEGLLRSVVFPGLWLDPEALLTVNGTRLLEVLDQGIQSKGHEEFVRMLAARRAGS